MNRFVEVNYIKDNTVFLKNGMLLAIIKIKPIDFGILSSNQQDRPKIISPIMVLQMFPASIV
jgi:type IV secretory pathway VirB4 component